MRRKRKTFSGAFDGQCFVHLSRERQGQSLSTPKNKTSHYHPQATALLIGQGTRPSWRRDGFIE